MGGAMVRYKKRQRPRLVDAPVNPLEKRLLESAQLDREPPGSLERCAEAVEKERNIPGKLKVRIKEKTN
jgi:hypothetical protein